VTRTRLPLKSMPRSTSSVVDVAPNELVMGQTSLFCASPYRYTMENGLIRSGGNLRLIYGGFLRFASAARSKPINVETKANGRGAQTPRRQCPESTITDRRRQVRVRRSWAECEPRRNRTPRRRRHRYPVSPFPQPGGGRGSVYRREVEQLVEAVPQLLETSPAGEALHQWMHLFVNYIATKRLIAPSLGAAVGRTSAPHATPAELITRAISTLVKVPSEAATCARISIHLTCCVH